MSVSPCAELYWFVVRLNGGERYATVRPFGPAVTSQINFKLWETSNFFKPIFETLKQILNTQNSHSYCNETRNINWQYPHSYRAASWYLLNYCTVQSAFGEANWFEASQEIPRISRKPNVHFCTHKRPPPVSILCQPNPVHTPTSHLLQFRPNIINPSTPSPPQWFFPSGIPTKTL